MDVNHYITLTRFRAYIRPKRLTPFRRVDGQWVTNDIPVRVRRVKGKSMALTLKALNGYASLLTENELEFVRKVAKRKGWILSVHNADLKIKRYKHLDGDMDCSEKLLDALERVGERLSKIHKRHIVIFIRSGKRDIAEQTKLYNQNMNPVTGRPYPGRPLTARPNPQAPHVVGRAADCGIEGRDICDFPGALDACVAEGVGFPVPGEDWHAEITDNIVGANS